MAGDADYNLFGFGVGKIKNTIVTHADAPAVAIFQFLATVWKGIVFEAKDCVYNPRLHVCRKA